MYCSVKSDSAEVPFSPKTKARFKDAATVMIINDNGVCVLPQVRIISSYKAIVSYTYQANPSIHPEYIVNSLENTLTNPQNDRVYKLVRY